MMGKRPAALDLSLLANVWALAEGGSDGESIAARHRARSMVEKHGKTLADIPGLLRGAPPAAVAAQQGGPFQNPFEGFGEWMEKREPGYGARMAEKKAEQERQEQDELAVLVERYGSVDAILKPNPIEAALRAAVLPWCAFGNDGAAEWIDTIDGTGTAYGADKMTVRVREALSEALPLPDTIAAALAEHRAWDARNRELELALGVIGDIRLDLPAWYRWEIVRELLESGLRATSLADVTIRQQYYCDGECDRPPIRDAVLLDLQHLAAMAAEQGVQNGQTPEHPPVAGPVSATERRNRIRIMLTDANTAGLPDREIARRVGVSPQTVGNIRQSMTKKQRELFAA